MNKAAGRGPAISSLRVTERQLAPLAAFYHVRMLIIPCFQVSVH
jgi:hypothetical protein